MRPPHPVDQVASAHQFEHSTVGGAINLCAAKACAIDSIHLWCHYFQFGVCQQGRCCIASIDGDPVPARPVASVNPPLLRPNLACVQSHRALSNSLPEK
ncbi:hypothetical protein PAPYR_11283 [Paratrimastix pyriformis]|uniref:Uncharacterized protein n=1 Tax=Paratrimastix pyriformis TaxID=342808 RepID=A0ABQ8U5U5_9EUKA|nr:hypothetical protein PAPYR_11283 [Paratrimastix pyriformis]